MTHDASATVPAAVASGYLHDSYAHSLSEFGTPRKLPRSGGWILERRIANTEYRDAMGCYPLFCCRDWSRLHQDIDALGDDLVSITLVTDPFGDCDEAYLRSCFGDVVIPFKQHYVIDLETPRNEAVSKHHRKCALRALRQLSVRVHSDPSGFLDEWMILHRNLVVKHQIRGIRAFSRQAFAEQMSMPGMVILEVSFAGQVVAALLYFVQGPVAHGHVLACTDTGYRMGALYAGIWHSMEHFGGRTRWINLMGVPGLQDAAAEGIRRFKLGWTHTTRTAWLCGRIINRQRYADLVAARSMPPALQQSYFPAYRAGEAD